MENLRITKQFNFEAAHALDGHDGKCKDIHGHSYQLQITLKGMPSADVDSPKCGMVMDFAELKAIVNKEVIDVFDHVLVLREDSRFKGLENENDRVMYVSYQPTCENMLIDMIHRLRPHLGDSLHSALLRETASSYAEWHASDN